MGKLLFPVLLVMVLYRSHKGRRMKHISTVHDIDGSIHNIVLEHKEVVISKPVCMYFWESYRDLEAWASSNNFEIRGHKPNGYLLKMNGESNG